MARLRLAVLVTVIAALAASDAFAARPVARRTGVAAKPAAAAYAKSLVPLYPDVVGEYLQIPGAPAAGTPAAFNTAAFLRLRLAADGAAPKAANAVIVAMPGFASTPAHWLYLGAQLVHKAAGRDCAGAPCRVEVWIVQRRGANLADTAGGRLARSQGAPVVALDYYFNRGVIGHDSDRPDRFPIESPRSLIGVGGGSWRPLAQADVPFMADWGLETYAEDVERMIGLVRQASGGRNVFLAGHSQGGGFVSAYAGRRLADGRRGDQTLAGLIFLDGGPSAGGESPMTEAEQTAYMDHVRALRTGKAPVFTDASGALGELSGPAAAAASMVVNAYYALSPPDSESIFAPRAVGASAASPAGDAFLRSIRLTLRARAGMSFDTDPVPGAGLQVPILTALGEGLGALDFKPRPGFEKACDIYAPKPESDRPRLGAPAAPVVCVPTPAMMDEAHVYGWIEGGVPGGTDVGTAMMWLKSQGFAPSRSNIRAARLRLASGGEATLDASTLPASNFYPSERYDFDAGFVGRYRVVKMHAEGVDFDIDKSVIAAPVFVARQSPAAQANNPFPGVSDFTEINRTGTYQTAEAKALSPIDPAVNVALYHHTDFVSADDSRAGQARPGEPGASAVADTLVDWVLKRSRGRASVPTPASLGVVETY